MKPSTTAPAAGVPTAPPLPADLEELLRRLRLPHIRAHAPEVVATAKAQRWEPAEVLKALFAQEVAGRERSALATRRAAAGFPTGKTFAAWDPEASSIPAPTQQALRTLEWVHRRENLVVCGPSGTGKTFLLEGLAVDALPGAPGRDDPAAGEGSIRNRRASPLVVETSRPRPDLSRVSHLA